MNKKQEKKLAAALYDWRISYIRMEQDPAVAKARKSVENAQKRLQKAEWTHRAYLGNAKHIIEEILPDLGESIIAFGIRAKYTKGYIRATYDRAVIDRLCADNTRLRNLLTPHRKESPVKPRINLEV